MKIAVKEVGKELQVMETNEEYRTDCVKAVLGKDCTVAFVRLNEDGTLCMGVDEEGLPMKLPTNFLLEISNPFMPIQKIVGAAVFVRHKKENTFLEELHDYEVEDLTEDDIEGIESLLYKDYQTILRRHFRDY